MLIRGIRGQPNRREFHEISRNDLLTVAPKKNRLTSDCTPLCGTSWQRPNISIRTKAAASSEPYTHLVNACTALLGDKLVVRSRGAEGD